MSDVGGVTDYAGYQEIPQMSRESKTALYLFFFLKCPEGNCFFTADIENKLERLTMESPKYLSV